MLAQLKKKRIQIASDLHLEFWKNQRWLEENPIIPVADVLVLAGDTFRIGDKYEEYDFIRKASKEFKAVYLIPGNHEYYAGHNIATTTEETFEEIYPNVFLVNNITIEREGVKMIFSTMWSEIIENVPFVLLNMADFHLAKYNGERFNTNHFNDIHRKCFQFIENEVAKPGKKIVITHHLPSNECNAKEFQGSKLNPAFCVEKTRFIAESDIDAWIYGHSHRNIPEFDINGTRLITNQLGYIDTGEHYSFIRDRVVEI